MPFTKSVREKGSTSMARMTFQNSKESFDLVAQIKPEGGDAENSVANAIHILAWVTIIGGLILGFLLGKDPYYDEFSFALAVVYWAAGIVTGIMLMGFAEIIRLLQLNATKEYKVYCNKTIFAQTTQENPAKNDTQVSGATDKKTIVEQDVSSVNQVEKEAHFVTRPEDTLECPLCGKKQSSKRGVCFDCGARFIFDDEK